MVADVAPFETLKLRMLNGAHSLLAYVGLLRGKTTVSESITDPAINSLLGEYFIEAAATLETTPGISHRDYAARLLERFANDALEHQLRQIAIDGSQKLPQRWLRGALENVTRGRPIRATAIGVAAWLAYVRGRNDAGDTWPVDDPLAARLAACHRSGASADDAVAALLSVREVFPQDLATHPEFRRAVLAACHKSREGPATLLQP
jgi:fructuronate reductase